MIVGMPSPRADLLVALALLFGGVAVDTAARADQGDRATAWYDPAPLLVSLRPDARAGIATALGVARLEDLPLYDLDLRYEPGGSSFALDEDVWFTNTTGASLPDLVFRIYANAAVPSTGPLVRLRSGSCADDPRCVITAPNSSALLVQPSIPLPPGGRTHLTLHLDGGLTRIDASSTNVVAQGLQGWSGILGGGSSPSSGNDYGILGVGDGIVSFGDFYPVLARRIAGVWERDEPSKLGDLGSDRMANFRARLEIPAQEKLAVSGAVTSERLVPGRAEHREVRVVAVAIRDFALLFGQAMESSTRDVRGTHVRSFYRSADRAAGGRVLDAAAHAFDDFERRFGAYPYTDLWISEAAVIGGAGGVEFSGLVTAASMFYHPAPAKAATPATNGADEGLGALWSELGGAGGLAGVPDGVLEFVVAHEVAHQWWHGLVGSDSRDHPYLDEALAQYSAILYLEDRYGSVRAEKDGAANVLMNYQMMRALGQPDAPADRSVSAFPASIAYAGIVYGKAPYFYKAARAALGDAAFFGALRGYVAQYRFREAPARGPADAFARAGGEGRMRPIERRWLDETHGDEDLGKLDLTATLGSELGGSVDDLTKALEQGAGAPGGLDVNLVEILKGLGGALP